MLQRHVPQKINTKTESKVVTIVRFLVTIVTKESFSEVLAAVENVIHRYRIFLGLTTQFWLIGYAIGMLIFVKIKILSHIHTFYDLTQVHNVYTSNYTTYTSNYTTYTSNYTTYTSNYTTYKTRR